MLALMFVRAYKIILARQYGFNHQGRVIGAIDQDPVTTKRPADTAPEFTTLAFTIAQQYDALAAIGHQHQRFCLGFDSHLVVFVWGFDSHLVVFVCCMRLLYLSKTN